MPRLRILIVDDNHDSADSLVTAFGVLGHDAVAAYGGREALERLEKVAPGLLVLDLSMPVMDGFEFVAALRAKPEWRDIPVVVVTAKDITAEERKQLNGHVERVMGKGTAELEELLGEIAVSLPAAISRHRGDKVV